jgi:hypothetical protein
MKQDDVGRFPSIDEAPVDSADQAQSKVGVAKWATECLRSFIDDQHQVEQLMHLSMRGISILRAMPKALDALAKADPDEYSTDDAWRRRKSIQETSELAQSEVDTDFPVLHAQAAISLWGAMEVLIRTLVAKWIQNRPDVFQLEIMKKLRVRLGEYESLSSEERAFYIADLIEIELSAGLKLGVGRFETLLEPFGLSGAVPDAVRRTIFELSQIRNVLVHRRGIADRRLVQQCPWLGLAIGDRVTISHGRYTAFRFAAMTYAMEILQRLRCRHGRERDDEVIRLQDEWSKFCEPIPDTSGSDESSL